MIQISLERTQQTCKRCGAKTDRNHDYRVRQVRDWSFEERRCGCCTARGDTHAQTAASVSQKETPCWASYALQPLNRQKIMLLHRRSSMKDIAQDTAASVGSSPVHGRHACNTTPAGWNVKGGEAVYLPLTRSGYVTPAYAPRKISHLYMDRAPVLPPPGPFFRYVHHGQIQHFWQALVPVGNIDFALVTFRRWRLKSSIAFVV